MASQGLARRLSRTLSLQIGFITLATILGVLTAKFVLEDVLIRQALVAEADYFWTKRDLQPEFPLPDTHNLTGYMNVVPQAVASLENGFHNDLEASQLILVSQKRDQRLFLIYDGKRVNQLAFFFGLVPLALVLLVLYLSSWMGFRASRRAISPVIALAHKVQTLDPQYPDPDVFEVPSHSNADDEIMVLTEAMHKFTTRLNEFVVRETHFTRDASHELRSPLTVIQMASDLLSKDPTLSESAVRFVERIKRSVRDMEELIGALLLLARESESGLPSESVCLNEVVADEVKRAKLIAVDKPIEAKIEEHCELYVDAPKKVLAVMLGNLLRNAFSYTDTGSVVVTINPYEVVITDSGVGMPADQVEQMYEPFVRGVDNRRGGYGVGLTIVRRLSDRFDWPVSVDSKPGLGTTVQISFPSARTSPN